MTIEEKLKHFYDTSVEEARRQAEKDVQEHKEPWMPHWRNIKKCLWKTPPVPAKPRLQTQSARSTRHFPQSSFTSGVTGLPDRAA